VLFSEPKIPQCADARGADRREPISVLFSEPKIPQSFILLTILARARDFSALQRAENSSIDRWAVLECLQRDFSALQRAENSSIGARGSRRPAAPTFQCSSASRKFLNLAEVAKCYRRVLYFSALQRAENSSIHRVVIVPVRYREFQCSSASRKFLNHSRRWTR